MLQCYSDYKIVKNEVDQLIRKIRIYKIEALIEINNKFYAYTEINKKVIDNFYKEVAKDYLKNCYQDYVIKKESIDYERHNDLQIYYIHAKKYNGEVEKFINYAGSSTIECLRDLGAHLYNESKYDTLGFSFNYAMDIVNEESDNFYACDTMDELLHTTQFEAIKKAIEVFEETRK